LSRETLTAVASLAFNIKTLDCDQTAYFLDETGSFLIQKSILCRKFSQL